MKGRKSGPASFCSKLSPVISSDEESVSQSDEEECYKKGKDLQSASES